VHGNGNVIDRMQSVLEKNIIPAVSLESQLIILVKYLLIGLHPRSDVHTLLEMVKRCRRCVVECDAFVTSARP